MEIKTMELIAHLRDQLCGRDDIIAEAKNAMNKECLLAPYFNAINSFPALAVLENCAPEWIEPLAQSLETNSRLLHAPLQVRGLHSALSVWKPCNRDQIVAIVVYGFLVERGKISHSPRDFIDVLMICID